MEEDEVEAVEAVEADEGETHCLQHFKQCKICIIWLHL
jgi:hypothetical protein